ncbi:unnamed protein product [Rotaria sordida]|uniref:Uncharacterized protein n=1 Tax=Rotaria sordida TaxID=392033 RepID=A0A815NCP8_9BILA|nr:unnamed protein product [Rotaria sordida]CAF4047927.1 unnamed protein product [Rotaria sordida]
MCWDICSTRLPLFILCPNSRTNLGLNRDRWISNVFPPNQTIPINIKNKCQLIGQLMEMEITIQQNQSIDIGSGTNYLFSSIMNELRFDIVSSTEHTYKLILGGQDIPLTVDNYCTYYREYRLNEFRR